MKPVQTRELAQSDPKELEAIERAMRQGDPTYWIRTTDGCTLDVHVHEGVALSAWKTAADRTGLGFDRVQCFKRVGSAFMPYAVPKTVQ